MSMDSEDALQRIERDKERYLVELLDYLRIPSISTDPEHAGDVARCAEFLIGRLRDGQWRNWPPGAAEALLAQLLERHGRVDEARALWKQLRDDEKFEDTAWASQAETRLAELGS